jgi:hypothetical protein
MPRIAVILENAPDTELDRTVLDLPPSADEGDVDDAISDVISGWMLSVGDTIKIREVA